MINQPAIGLEGVIRIQTGIMAFDIASAWQPFILTKPAVMMIVARHGRPHLIK